MSSRIPVYDLISNQNTEQKVLNQQSSHSVTVSASEKQAQDREDAKHFVDLPQESLILFSPSSRTRLTSLTFSDELKSTLLSIVPLSESCKQLLKDCLTQSIKL